MRVPVYERSESMIVPSVRSGTSVPDLGGIAAKSQERAAKSVSGGLNVLAAGLEALGEQRDKAAAVAAVNSFMDWNNDYLRNPQSGVLTRKGFNVMGLSEASDRAYKNKLAEMNKGLKTDYQRRLFADAVAGTVRGSMANVMAHEFNGTVAAKNEQLKAGLSIAGNAIAADFLNDATFNAQQDNRDLAVRELWGDYGADMLNAKLAESLSEAHGLRLNGMIRKDPRLARRYFEQNKKEILGETQNKFESAIKSQELLLWTQENADSYMHRFSDEKGAIADIRKNYQGEQEERLVSAVKSRFNEREIKAASADAALHKQQQANYERIVDGISIKGEIPTLEQLEQLRLDKGLSVTQFANIKNSLSSLATRSTAEKRGRIDPDYASLSPMERERQVRQFLNISDEMRTEVVTSLDDALWSGTLSNAALGDAYTRGFISKEEAEGYRKDFAGISASQRAFARDDLSVAKNRMKALAGYEKPYMVDDFITRANERIRALDPKSPDYRKQVREACNDVSVEVINENYKSKYSMGGLIETDFFLNEAGKLLRLVQNNDYTGNPFGGQKRYSAGQNKPKPDAAVKPDTDEVLKATLRK